MRVSVLALGNVLMGDDALGPHVIARLRAGWDFPPEVEIEDLGTPGLDLHPFLAGNDALVIVDVVKSQGAPGELRLYRKDEILKHPPGPRVSPHDPGLKEALLGLQLVDDDPEVLLVGVIPGKIPHLVVGLTDEVSAAIPAAIDAVLAELGRLGAPAVKKAEPAEPDLWWENRPDAEGGRS